MVVVLYFWKVKRGSVPFAVLRMALDRIALKTQSGVSFFKLLGCGKGVTFTPSDADMHRWGLLVCIDEKFLDSLDVSPNITSWREHSEKEFRLLLDPISSHGRWSGKSPFLPTTQRSAERKVEGRQIVAITRARVRFQHYRRFLKSVPEVVESLHASPGLITTFGIGEAPIGLQGTFSLWESESSLRDFAFKTAAHRKAISETEQFSWFSEELFARFEVRDARGSL